MAMPTDSLRVDLLGDQHAELYPGMRVPDFATTAATADFEQEKASLRGRGSATMAPAAAPATPTVPASVRDGGSAAGGQPTFQRPVPSSGPRLPALPRILSMPEWVAVNYPQAVKQPFIYRGARLAIERQYQAYLQQVATTWGMQQDMMQTQSRMGLDAARTRQADRPRNMQELLAGALAGNFTMPPDVMNALIQAELGGSAEYPKTFEAAAVEGMMSGSMSGDQLDQLVDMRHRMRGGSDHAPTTVDGMIAQGVAGLIEMPPAQLQRLIDLKYPSDPAKRIELEAATELLRDPNLSPSQRMKRLQGLKKGDRGGGDEGILAAKVISERLIGGGLGERGLLDDLTGNPVRGWLELSRYADRHQAGMAGEEAAALERLVNTNRPTVEQIVKAIKDGEFTAHDPYFGGPDPEEIRQMQADLEYVVRNALDDADQQKLLARQKDLLKSK